VLARRDATLADYVDPMFGEQRRQMRLLRRRGLLEEQRHRLLVAVLVNLPDADSVAAAMAELFPGRVPSDVTHEIVEELSSAKYRGLSGMHLTPDNLEAVRTALRQNRFGDALAMLGDQWHPASLSDLA
jgi:hypothetical protein